MRRSARRRSGRRDHLRSALPTFVVIGAKKAGTTSLHRYLSAHPQVWVPSSKRLEFFSTDRWERGVGWYEDQFARGSAHRVRGEISTSYTRHPLVAGVPQRMREVVPDVRLVYLVRDPIERIASHYRSAYLEGWERRSIDEAVLADAERFLDPSRYAFQIEQYLAHYPREQLLVVTAEDLRSERRGTLVEILRFIGADPTYEPPNLDATYHRADQIRSEGAALRALRRSSGFQAVRSAVHPAVRERLWRLATRRPRVAAPSVDLSPGAYDEVMRRLRPDLVALRGIVGQQFHCWGLLGGTVER